MEDEDYEFDYEDSDQDQDDGQVDMENEYYTAKGAAACVYRQLPSSGSYTCLYTQGISKTASFLRHSKGFKKSLTCSQVFSAFSCVLLRARPPLTHVPSRQQG